MDLGVLGKGYPIRISSDSRSFSRGYISGLRHISMNCVICIGTSTLLAALGFHRISMDLRPFCKECPSEFYLGFLNLHPFFKGCPLGFHLICIRLRPFCEGHPEWASQAHS